jgi:hypothetical protein
VTVLAIETTQWIIAIGSLGSALVALALGFGLKDWVVRPRVRLILRREDGTGEISDRLVTQRLSTGELAAFVRLRVDNRGRSTARNVGVRLLKTLRWDPASAEWIRSRPELDGRLLQPSNHQINEPDLLDVFPHTDRIVDLASVQQGDGADDLHSLCIEISRPWPPNEANLLDPATWRLELLVCGDNIRPERSFVTVTFDGNWPDPGSAAIWEHFLIEGPTQEDARAAPDRGEALQHREHARNAASVGDRGRLET